MFERDAQEFEATVTCVATQEGQVMGFVTDRLMQLHMDAGRFIVLPIIKTNDKHS